MKVIERIVLKWRADGVGPNPGASQETLGRLERQVGATLPDDVRLFFSLADGMPDGETDEYLLSFWSVDRILREVKDMRRTGCQIDPRDTPIADYLINSWLVFLRRLEAGRVGVWVEGAAVEVPSLTDFFKRYESDPNSLGLAKDSAG